MSRSSRILGGMLAGMVVALSLAERAGADPRRFGYVYEATTMPAGHWEYEQWVTWKTHKDSDPDYDRFEFRHEFEYGLTDRLQLALYVADWRYQDGRSVADDKAEYRNTAFEVIYSLSDPTADLFGSALYGEVQLGPEKFELEGKVIVQKNVGPLVAAYNATVEGEWESAGYDESKGVFEQSVGLGADLLPWLTTGVELLHEVEFKHWEQTGEHVLYLGPNLGIRKAGWFITVTPLFQVTDVAGQADYQTRLLFGIEF